MWPECSCGCYKYELGFYDTTMYDTNKKFIATFDPEHVALMEAVIAAGYDSDDKAVGARVALNTYRRERGLTGQ